MKVRIAGNKMRFRLRKQDVSALYETGKLTEVLEFGLTPQDRLAFILQTSATGEAKIEYESGAITVLLPGSVGEELSKTERVGFDFDIDTGKDKRVYVLLEKDFSCLDGSDADNEDTYANPNEQAC